MAVAHSQLEQAYHLLRDGSGYKELGATHFDRLDPERHARRLVSRLQRLGYNVSIDRAA